MGTFAYMLKALEDIEPSEDEINPNEEEDLRTLAQTVTTQDMQPHATEQDIYRLIELHPLHPIHHRPLTHYNRETRAIRRMVSEKVRNAMAWYLLKEQQLMKKYEISRHYSTLFNFDNSENDPHNEEVSRLFIKRTDAEEQKFRRGLALTRVALYGENKVKALLTVEQEMNVEYPRRRAEFIMRRIEECVLRYEKDIVPFIKKGTGINGLVDKFNAAMEISSAIMEIDYFLTPSDAEIEYISFNDEEKQRLKDIKDSYQPIMTVMRESLATTANPCFEFISPAELADYDCTAIAREYSEAMKAGYLNPVDSFTLMLDDRLGIERGRDTMLLDNLKEIKRLFNMQTDIHIQAEHSDAIQSFVGDDAVTQLCAGHPIAISRDDDVIIVTRTGNPDGGELAVNAPMEYFNHYFGAKKIEITEKLIEADPFYIRSSPEFRAMRRTLEQVVLLPDLAENASAETKQQYRKLFETLAEQASIYFNKKLEKNHNELNKRERKRVQLAKDVENFARMKIKHLEIVDAARSTALRYDREKFEQEAIEKQIQESRKYMQQEEQNDGDGAAELNRLRQMEERYAANVPGLANALSETYKDVWRSCEEIDGEIEPYSVTHELLVKLAGAMVAAELVGEEKKALRDKGVQGVCELLLCGENSDKVRYALGEEVVHNLFGHELGTEYYEETKNFITTFDPSKCAADIKGTFEKKFGVSFIERLAAKYRDTIKPMRGKELDDTEKAFLDWTCKNILKPGCDYCAHFAGNEENVDYLAANKILASCVLHNMVQIERASLGGQAPGGLETMLADPEASKNLLQRVMITPEFEKLADELGLSDLDDNVRADILPKAIEDQLPRKVAESIFKTAFAEQTQVVQKAVAPQTQKQTRILK